MAFAIQYEFVPVVIAQISGLALYDFEQRRLRLHWKSLSLHLSVLIGSLVTTVVLHFYSLVDYIGYEKAISWFTGKFTQRTYSEIATVIDADIHKNTRGVSTPLTDVFQKYFVDFDLMWGRSVLFFLVITLILFTVAFALRRVMKDKIYPNAFELLTISLILFFATTSYFIVFKSQAADHYFGNSFFYRSLFVFFVLLAYGSFLIESISMIWARVTGKGIS